MEHAPLTPKELDDKIYEATNYLQLRACLGRRPTEDIIAVMNQLHAERGGLGPPPFMSMLRTHNQRVHRMLDPDINNTILGTVQPDPAIMQPAVAARRFSRIRKSDKKGILINGPEDEEDTFMVASFRRVEDELQVQLPAIEAELKDDFFFSFLYFS